MNDLPIQFYERNNINLRHVRCMLDIIVVLHANENVAETYKNTTKLNKQLNMLLQKTTSKGNCERIKSL